jgi:hypothetical protein
MYDYYWLESCVVLVMIILVGSFANNYLLLVALFSAAMASRASNSRKTRSSSSSDRDSSDDKSSSGYSSSTASGGDESVHSLVPSVVVSPKPRTPQVVRSNKRGIEPADQKVILQHIEQFGGGIAKVREDITAFCNHQVPKSTNTTLLYGTQYDKVRTRVENKIRVWAKLSKEDYSVLLKDLGVTAATVTQASGVPSSVPHVKFSPAPKVSAPPASIPKKVNSGSSPGIDMSTKKSGKEKESQPKSEPPTSIKTEKPDKMSRFEVKDGVVHGKSSVFILHLRMAGSQHLTPFLSY